MRTTSLLCAAAMLLVACGGQPAETKGPTPAPAKLRVEYYEISEK